MTVMQSVENILFASANQLLFLCPPLVLFLRVGFSCFVFLFGTLPFMVKRFGFKRIFLSTNSTYKFPQFAIDAENGVHSTFTTSDGINLHMVSKGDPKSKEVFLFVHGFPECWYSWRYQMEYFSENGFRCVALSLRGYGESSKPLDVGSYSLLRLVNDVKETIEHLGNSKVTLIGHDWGGAIAWVVAMEYPELIKSLIILNAPLPHIMMKLQKRNLRQFLSSWYMYFFQLPSVPEWFVRTGNFAFLEMCFGRVLKKGLMSEEDLGLFKHYSSQPHALTSMINYYRSSMRSPGQLRSISVAHVVVPTLVVWGEDDTALTIDNLRGLSDYVEDLEVARLPGISHFVQQEDPTTVNYIIINYFKSRFQS